MQSNWASQLNPVLANPLTNVTILKNVALTSGTNIINHKLGQTPQGWFIVDTNAAINLYRSKPFNDLTLTLVSSASATVNLAVF